MTLSTDFNDATFQIGNSEKKAHGKKEWRKLTQNGYDALNNLKGLKIINIYSILNKYSKWGKIIFFSNSVPLS